MKITRIIVALILAVLMAVTTPINCIAAEGKQYIKEIRIGYGNEGKQKLKDDGYTVWEELNANDGATGGDVWFGYKTTDKKEEGITDIGVMNMKGGYSFSEYNEMISDLKKNVTDKQKQIFSAVSEFSKNYAGGSEYAKAAMKVLNCFYYDEEGEENISLGDLFTAKELDKNAIYKICLEGNTESLNAVVSALSLGICEYTGDTVIKRLENTKYGAKSGKTNVESKAVTDAIEKFKIELIQAEETYETATAYDGGKDAYLESKESTGNLDEVYYVYLYEVAKEVKFGNTGLSLYDAMMLPLDDPNEEEESEEEEEEATDSYTYIDQQMTDMLVKSLTYGQIGVIGTVGLGSVICNAYATALKIDNPTGQYKTKLDLINEELNNLDDTNPISIFEGVDRSLIEHPEDIAITTEALRQEAKKNETDVGKIPQSSWIAENYKTFCCVATVAATLTAGMFATAVCSKSQSKYNLVRAYTVKCGKYEKSFQSLRDASSWSGFLEKFDASNADMLAYLEKQSPDLYELLQSDPNAIANMKSKLSINDSFANREQLGLSYSKFASNLYVVSSIVSAIAMVITIVFAVLVIISGIKAEEKKIKYTQIPRAIVDTKNDANEDAQFFVYYAAKQITATDDDTDFKNLYGDLNAFNNVDEWLCLYCSKDTRLGEPLTTNIMVKNTATLTDKEKAKYLAVHDLGYSVAKDLNYYNSGTAKKNVYLFIERSVPLENITTSSSGSLFNIENTVIAVSFLAVGAFVAYAITYTVMKKKRKVQES